MNLHFPMQHHAPHAGCARAHPSAALHASGGWLLRVFRRNPNPNPNPNPNQVMKYKNMPAEEVLAVLRAEAAAQL